VTLTNTGSPALHVSSIAISGAQAADFTETSKCSANPIAVGGSCTVEVTFTPGATGIRAATLFIASDDPHTPSSVSLRGGASDPPTDGHHSNVFPQRDFVSADGYTDVDSNGHLIPVVVSVYRNGVLPRSSEPIVPAADPKALPGDPFASIVEVNHPGGGCWAVQTPDILPGDVIRTTVGNTGRMDQTTVANVIAQSPVQIDATTIQIHGTARNADGTRMGISQLEQRMVANQQAFVLSGGKVPCAPRRPLAPMACWSGTSPTIPTALAGRSPIPTWVALELTD
jgi:hypothetical protein